MEVLINKQSKTVVAYKQGQEENLTHAIIKLEKQPIAPVHSLNSFDPRDTETNQLGSLPCMYLSIPLCKHETDAPKQVRYM